MSQYYQESPLKSGWKGIGNLNGENKEKVVSVNAKIIRSIRCVYSYVDSSKNMLEIANELIGG